MNIVKASAKLMNLETREEGIQLLRRIEYAARVSHASESAQTADSWERFIPAVVMGHGDWSVTEHASVSVDFVVDRAIQLELVRHRLFSYTASSTRFINYAKANQQEMSFIAPTFKDGPTRSIWEVAVTNAEIAYKCLIGNGESPQVARSVLPNSLSSRIIVTGNLRSFRHLFLMRTSKEAHPAMREVMIPLLEEFQSKIPLLFDDIEPNQRQVDNLRKAR
jgi:thymidylate synthase (FAD)